MPGNWSVVGDDNNGNIYWRNTAGDVAVRQVSGAELVNAAIPGNVPGNWVIAGLSDFNSDGLGDMLWRDSQSGTVAIWLLNSTLGLESAANLGVVGGTWAIVQTWRLRQRRDRDDGRRNALRHQRHLVDGCEWQHRDLVHERRAARHGGEPRQCGHELESAIDQRRVVGRKVLS